MNKHFSRSILAEDNLSERALINPLILQLQELAALPSSHFEIFYRAPIQRFLRLTQHCPEEDLARHLGAVVKSMKLRRSIILPMDSDAESINKKKDLWTFAVFVGSMMFNATSLVCKQVVYREQHEFLKWSPFGAMIPPSAEIKVLGDLPVSRFATNALLPLVFCSHCLSWLYRDCDAFNAAINLAHSPESLRIGGLITRAHARDDSDGSENQHAAEKYQTKNQHTERDSQLVADQVKDTPKQEIVTPPLAFRDWLRQSIEDQQLSHCICETLNGYAVADPEIFIQYGKKVGVPCWEREKEAFLELGIHQNCPDMIFSGGLKKPAFIIPRANDL